VGAYERDNFGDLLYLLVTERYLTGADVVAAAPFAADMRPLLGRRIPAYGPLLRDEAFDAVWTVGGQVGRVDLERAFKMSARPRTWRRYARSGEARRRAILRRSTGGVSLSAPYIPALADFPGNAGALGVLNSVGIAGVRGLEPERRDPIVRALRAAGAVGVRDRGSSAFLAGLGVEHRLLPDAVHALGVLEPDAREPDEAAIVQVSRSRLRMLGHARLGRTLAASPQLAGRPVRLLLAGTATGHDSADDYERVARAARRAARGIDIAILEERRPLELARHIARARVAIGTSLHVRIVAAAHGVPRVSLAKPKPTRYARQWDPDMPFDAGLEDLDAAVEAALRRAREAGAGAHAEGLAVAAHEQLEALARRVTTARPTLSINLMDNVENASYQRHRPGLRPWRGHR
jgi:hypothetical protein